MSATSTQDRVVVATLSISATVLVLWLAGAFARGVDVGSGNAHQDERSQDGSGAADELAALRAEVQQLRSRVATQRMEAEGQPAADPGVENSEVAAEPEKAAMQALFDDPEWQELLAGIDWVAAGTTMHEMLPIMEQIREAMLAGEQPLEAYGKLQRLNAGLVELTGKLVEAGLPGEGPNGAFTHPTVSANLMAQTLAAAGAGLSETQQEAMASVMRHYRAEMQGLEASGMDSEFALDRVLAETEMKDRMFEEMQAGLSEEQRAALGSQANSGRVGMDMFDSGLVWGQFMRPVGANNPAEYVSGVSQQLSSGLRMSPAQAESLNSILDEWKGTIPLSIWSDPLDPMTKNQILPTDLVRGAAARQADLLRRIAAGMQLSAEQLEKLRELRTVTVPMRR